MNASNFMDIFGLGPIYNHLNLLGVGRNSLRGYYETSEDDLIGKERALLEVAI